MAITGYGIGEHPDNGSSHLIGISAATFMSKVCASTVTYPHEVLRTRLTNATEVAAGAVDGRAHVPRRIATPSGSRTAGG
ncbi:Mitochondrial carrier protein, partial [Aspergillus sclerotialis]